MKSYLLLRDNKESGPYTLEDFRKKGLQPADLIWVEGESRSWKFPAEFDELRRLVKTPVRNPVRPKNEEASSGLKVVAMQSTNKNLLPQTPPPAVDYSSYLHKTNNEEEEREIFSDYKLQSTRRKGFSIASNLIALLVLAIGVAMTAYVVRSIVLSFGGETLQSAQATEIQSVSFEAEHAAYAADLPVVAAAVTTTVQMEAQTEEPVVEKPAEPAQEKETFEPVLPVTDKPEAQKVDMPEVVKPVPEKETKEKKEAVEDPTADSEKTDVGDKDKKVNEKATKESSSKNIRSQLKLSGSDYTVGLFGGISDLVLNVSNNSGTDVQSAVVEIVYLNKGGSVVGRKTMEVQGLQAGGSKKLQVPSNNRGVKAEYRIVDVEVKG